MRWAILGIRIPPPHSAVIHLGGLNPTFRLVDIELSFLDIGVSATGLWSAKAASHAPPGAHTHRTGIGAYADAHGGPRVRAGAARTAAIATL